MIYKVVCAAIGAVLAFGGSAGAIPVDPLDSPMFDDMKNEYLGEGEVDFDYTFRVLSRDMIEEPHKKQVLRTLEKKLIRANEGNKRDYAPVEFYDLAVDPGEQNNLAGEDQVAEAVFQKALDDMDAFIKEGAVEPEAFDLEDMSQEELDRLRSLGYLSGEDDKGSDTDSEE